MDKEHVVHIHNGILLSHKGNEILSFASLWMESESAKLSNLSQAQTDRCHNISCVETKYTYTDDLIEVKIVIVVTRGAGGK